jgi:serine/threonine protein kinase
MLKQGPLSGQTLGGKYLLGELLGQGGFGAVYRAENQMLHRQQAVKVLLEERFSEEKFRERFLREARTLAALDHANIVHVDDIGMEGNLIYLVMPYISGGTLQDLMKARSGPLALEQITRYLEQICSALGYAHAQGVVHLDLKPSNLLVHKDGRLLLSDFGLAHLMEQGAIEGGTSLQFGSPLYMAPEQFDGKPSRQSDLYALGVILYQMLAGRHPFEASTPAAVMRKHLTEPPPSLRTAQPDLPVALDAVLAKALAKQPEQRYGRAGELLVDFRAALGGQALQFSSPADATQRTQLYLASTLRDAQPPSPPPILTGGGPAIPTPSSQPPAPGKLKLWTQRFTWLFGAIALAGAAVTIFVDILLGNIDNINFVAINWIIVVILAVLASICLVGSRFASSKLLRAGLFLQTGSLASNMVLFMLFLSLDTGWGLSIPLGGWIDIALPLLVTVLNAVSLVIISYGIARWRSAQDVGFTVLPIIVSGIVSYLLFNALTDVDFSFWIDEGGSGFLLWITVTAALFAASVFLLRSACWKQHPIVTFLLALGAVLFVPQAPGGYFLIEQWSSTALQYFRVLYSTFLLSWLLLMLGFLLLIQTERVRKRARWSGG